VNKRRGDIDSVDRHESIMQAVLRLLGQHGISGVSMRAVAVDAGVSLGLVNYHYTDKAGLIAAALRRIGEEDLTLLKAPESTDHADALRAVIRRIARPEYLTTEYLSLRLQLWSLAQANEEFARINADAQEEYRKGLAALIRAARPDLTARECTRRAADIDVIQNGIWLTALLGLDRAAVRRNMERCEEIALSD
jgi:AcrR family transcriptional regulator